MWNFMSGYLSIWMQYVSWSFIVRKDSILYENGFQFKWISYNVPNLLLLEGAGISQAEGCPTGQFQCSFNQSICCFDEWIPPTVHTFRFNLSLLSKNPPLKLLLVQMEE
jgi:hypothetical protein